MCPYGSLWVLLGPYACLCVLMDSNGSSWDYIDLYVFSWVLMCPYGSLSVLIGPYLSLWVLIGPYAFLCHLMVFNRSL